MNTASLRACATALALGVASSQYFLPPIPLNGRTVVLPAGYIAILSHKIASATLHVSFTVSGSLCNLYLATSEPTCSSGYSVSVPASSCSYSPIASATGSSPNTITVNPSDSFYGFGNFLYIEVIS